MVSTLCSKRKKYFTFIQYITCASKTITPDIHQLDRVLSHKHINFKGSNAELNKAVSNAQTISRYEQTDRLEQLVRVKASA